MAKTKQGASNGSFRALETTPNPFCLHRFDARAEPGDLGKHRRAPVSLEPSPNAQPVTAPSTEVGLLWDFPNLFPPWDTLSTSTSCPGTWAVSSGRIRAGVWQGSGALRLDLLPGTLSLPAHPSGRGRRWRWASSCRRRAGRCRSRGSASRRMTRCGSRRSSPRWGCQAGLEKGPREGQGDGGLAGQVQLSPALFLGYLCPYKCLWVTALDRARACLAISPPAPKHPPGARDGCREINTTRVLRHALALSCPSVPCSAPWHKDAQPRTPGPVASPGQFPLPARSLPHRSPPAARSPPAHRSPS